MKRIALCILFVPILFGCTLFEQPIQWYEARNFVGATKTVCGLVVRVGVVDVKAYKVKSVDFGYTLGESDTDIITRVLNGRGLSFSIEEKKWQDFPALDSYRGKRVCVRAEIMSTGSGAVFLAVDNTSQISVQ